MGVDYAYMQPNHYWDDKGARPLSRYFSDIKTYDLAMEFEFEETLLEGQKNCDLYNSASAITWPAPKNTASTAASR
mgnify:CR=1 FL=1